MPDPANNEVFASWRRALAEQKLSPQQLEILEDMVSQGQAKSVEAAAEMCDWRDNILNPEEHMWGF